MKRTPFYRRPGRTGQFSGLRERVIWMIQTRGRPVTGSEIAEKFGVTLIEFNRVANANSQIDDRRRHIGADGRNEHSDCSNPDRLADTHNDRQQSGCWPSCGCKCTKAGIHTGRSIKACRMGDANLTRLEGLGGNDCAAGWQGATGPVASPGVHMWALEVNGFWRDADWLFCRDGKWRPVEPGTFPLVDGAAARMGRVEPGVARVASSNRTGRLKGYGNAINAQAAAEFIRVYMEGL